MGTLTNAEILSEPDAWIECLNSFERDKRLETLDRVLPRGVEWIFIGCGSSYYAALTAAVTWTILTGERARAVPASEVLLFPQTLPIPFQPVLISRSGQTSEILQAASFLQKQLRLPSLAITCGTATALEKLCAHAIQLPAADDKSTVMTRSFTSMLLALQALAAVRARDVHFLKSLRAVAGAAKNQMPGIRSRIQSLVNSQAFADYVFLGQGPFFGVAQEAMLKVKEMSCSYAQCFHTLEFRHGPKAIVSSETLLTFFISENGFDAEVPMLEEMKSLGGRLLVVTHRATPAIQRSADFLIELGLDVPEPARAIAAVIPGQLLGYYTGIRKGLDPDEPKNLTRVVMLESDGEREAGRGAT
jgi:glucosamine--fructose-6-phosphate aminotransferase (isomerizing)